jgi:hypothetical protein
MIVKTAKRLKVVAPSPTPAIADTDEADGGNNNNSGPPFKRLKLAKSVFASYQQQQSNPSSAAAGQVTETVESLVDKYIEYISKSCCCWQDVPKFEHYANLWPLLEYIFCAPATSAPVERIFSQGGLFVRPHRARLSDRLLCQLMFIKCNDKLA